MNGSAWLRAYQLTEVSPRYQLWKHGMKYDALLFQKSYWPEMMDLFDGPKVLDLCDPDWFREHLDIVSMGRKVDAVTCSSPALTQLVKAYFPSMPIVCIPDRLNLSSFPFSKPFHQGKARHAVWFGYIHNAHETLPQMSEVLERHGLSLTIVSDAPYELDDAVAAFRPQFVHFDLKTLSECIKRADMVLNPRSERAFFRYKSLNKSIISWQLGVPVAVTPDDVERFLDAEERNEEVMRKRFLVRQEYDIRQSVAQFDQLFNNLFSRKQGHACN